MAVKILTTAALIFVSLFFFSGYSVKRKSITSTKNARQAGDLEPTAPAGEILRRVDLPEYRDSNATGSKSSTRSTGSLEAVQTGPKEINLMAISMQPELAQGH